jgi:hypothetical protein
MRPEFRAAVSSPSDESHHHPLKYPASSGVFLLKNIGKIAPSVHNSKDEHIVFLHCVGDDVFPYWERARALARCFAADASEVRGR